MINIAICDDDDKELNNTKKVCLIYAAKFPEEDIRVESFQSPSLLLDRVMNEKVLYDIFLLDIYMPEMTGTELAHKVRENNDKCQIIFLTTSINHAIEAFSLHAIHYLVKPYTAGQLEEALARALAVVEKVKKSYLILKSTTGIQKVLFSEILYCETEGHIQSITLTLGTYLRVRITSDELFKLLSVDERFYKCGKTYIISLDKIKEVTSKYINFDYGQQLPMLRRQYKELLDRYTRYSLNSSN